MTSKKTPLAKPSAAAKELGLTKLKESGLDLDDAKKLGLEFLTANQAAMLGHDPVPCIKIPYFDKTGKPLSTWPKHPPFYRVRLFMPAGFDDITDGKVKRYSQPQGGTAAAYFPQTQDWDTILDDPLEPLLFTEGEFKAACACKYGFPTIGLGGVHNWHSHPKGVEFLPELEAIKWVGRNVYIVFDSDYQTNPLVCMALKEFAEALVERGAFPYVATLPALPELKKTGLDDYLVAEGAEALERVLHAAVPLGLTRVLFRYNEKFVFVRDPGLIVDQHSLSKIAMPVFTNGLESTKTYQEASLAKDGTMVYRPVAAAAAWLTWPLRSEADRLTYRPGQPKVVGREFNVWPGWGLQPIKGNVKPFLKLIDHLFQGAEPEAKQWFLRWCAYPLQHPGTKMFSSAVFQGMHHGTGKTLVGMTLGLIYGKNYASIGQDDLHSSFNQWAESKQFVMGDDVTGSDKREDNDRLKKLITQTEVWVNTKYIPSYMVPDCINYFLNTNHADAFFLEDTDRRLFIHEVIVSPLTEEFYRQYMDWLKKDRPKQGDETATGGAAHVFDYLLHLPLGDFNPAAAAFKTAARARMIETVQSDVGGWCRQLRDNPDHILRVGDIAVQRDLFSNQELLEGFYDKMGKTRVTANGLGRALKDAGFRQVNNGTAIKLSDGSLARYYAVRHAEQWLTAPFDACRQHLEKARMSAVKPGGKKF